MDKHRYIKADRSGATVEQLCRLLEVSCSGYYAWLHGGDTKHHTAKSGTATRVGRSARDLGKELRDIQAALSKNTERRTFAFESYNDKLLTHGEYLEKSNNTRLMATDYWNVRRNCSISKIFAKNAFTEKRMDSVLSKIQWN